MNRDNLTVFEFATPFGFDVYPKNGDDPAATTCGPPPPAKPWRLSRAHDLSVPHSGRYRCLRCGLDFESNHSMVGLAVVSDGTYIVHSRGKLDEMAAAYAAEKAAP